MKPYILFGAGDCGTKFLKHTKVNAVAFFCDNNKEGKIISGVRVISYEELLRIYNDYRIVITVIAPSSIEQISKQLYRDRIPFVLYSDEMERIVREEETVVYQSLNTRPEFAYHKEFDYFFALDRFNDAGAAGTYFWQDLWAAKHIFERRPIIHCDIGSRIDGFIAHLLSFNQKVRLFDIRPFPTVLPGVEFFQCDATMMNNIEDNSVESLSALCSLEHFGLGRYGDPIDPEACFKCFEAIKRKLSYGGRAYISLPVGKSHVVFNAHRVFEAELIKELFNPLKLLEYSVAKEDRIEYNVKLSMYDNAVERDGAGVGLFVFEKQ